MRPRPDATENAIAASLCARPCGCFNEAAARCHGKPETPRSAGPVPRGFNEAAARCHGKRT